MTLHISKSLDLPDESVTQTFGILAKRGMGKTYTASVIAEEMLKNNLHVVVIDPIGVWYGLRSSANGKKEGLPIIIAGGEHADIPINPDSGEVLAELIIDNRLSMVVDVSLFRKGEQVRFMTAFAETLYRKNRNALHLILDEADAFAPQRPMPGEQRLLGAIEDIVRRGRARGLGVTMITQRPSVLNKNVLTQIEVLVALRLTAPIDQKAVDEWVKTNAEEGEREEFLSAIGSLPVGTAYFWSPGWLKIFKKVEVRKRETLDSSSTPVAGKEVIKAEKMADVNLDAIREKLEATVEKVESNDPKVLKKRITELEKQLATKPKAVETVTIEVMPDALVKQIIDYTRQIEKLTSAIDQALMDESKKLTPKFKEIQAKVKAHTISDHAAAFAVAIDSPEVNDGWRIGPGEMKILVASGQYPKGVTRTHLGILTGYKRSSRNTYIARLSQHGLVSVDGDSIVITDLGIKKLGNNFEPLPTGPALREKLVDELPPGESAILKMLIDAYPDSVNRDDITEKTGYARSSRNTYISRMSIRGIVKVSGSLIAASDELFE